VLKMQVFAFVASAYTLTVATESNIRTLQSDVPYSSSVGKDRLMLFQSPLPASHLDQYNLRVSVSATSGRVGVYMSCVNHSPSNVSHDYALYYPASSSSSSATAAWQDLSGLGLRDLGCDRGTGSWLYLSVQGDGVAASFTLTLHPLSNPAAVLLAPGLPLAGPGLEPRSFEYYYILADLNFYKDLQLHLTVTTGDADIFVSANWDSRPRLDGESGNVVSYLYSSATSGSEDFTLSHQTVMEICQVPTS
jgi:hypothetical protein